MQMVSVKKTQFSALNDKKFYFFDEIVTLTFGYYLSEEARLENKNLQKAIHQIIQEKISFESGSSCCSPMQRATYIEVNFSSTSDSL